MGRMKSWLEDISVEMGLDGEINDEVKAEGQRRLDGVAEDNEDKKDKKMLS